jgi:hypothetical protein
MAGLLDLLNSEQGVMALSLLSAARPQPGPRDFGGGLLQALGAGQQFRAAQDAKKEREQDRAMRQQAFEAQQQQQAIALQQLQRQMAEQDAVRQWRQSIPSPQMGAAQQALSAGGGPTQANAAAMPAIDPRLSLIHSGMKAGAIPVSEYLAATGPKAGPKLKNVESMRGPDGRMVNVALFEDGSHKVLPYGVRPEIALQNLGDRVVAIDKNSTQGGESFNLGQSPDSKASNQLGWANYGLSKQRLAQEGSGQLVETPNGYVRVGRDNTASPITIGGVPLMGKGSGMTEDQGKATGWLVQAENAYKNMKAAGFDEKGNPKSAAYPGVNDALSQIPALAPFANAMRGPDRQKFIQASSSLSEALLRAATGAGINKDEAAQKVLELTPQFGEDAEVTKQKMDAIPLYIESLKVRSGPGAAKAAGIAPTGIKFLGFEN